MVIICDIKISGTASVCNQKGSYASLENASVNHGQCKPFPLTEQEPVWLMMTTDSVPKVSENKTQALDGVQNKSCLCNTPWSEAFRFSSYSLTYEFDVMRSCMM